MTVRELLNLAPQVLEADITVRNNGLYNYRFILGENIRLYDGYTSKGKDRHGHLIKGELIEFNTPDIRLPATFYAIDPRKIDKKVLELSVTDLRLMRVDESYLYSEQRKGIGWEPVKAYITCDIGNEPFNGVCRRVKEEAKKEKTEITGQMDINDFLGGKE
jgi:hypothetical protein